MDDPIERLRSHLRSKEELTIECSFQSGSFEGKFYSARVVKELRSENTRLKNKLAKQEALIGRLKEDAERLARYFIQPIRGNGDVYECAFCNAEPKLKQIKLTHDIYCPIAIHEELMKELE